MARAAAAAASGHWASPQYIPFSHSNSMVTTL
jgi:hypothetical protein